MSAEALKISQKLHFNIIKIIDLTSIFYWYLMFGNSYISIFDTFYFQPGQLEKRRENSTFLTNSFQKKNANFILYHENDGGFLIENIPISTIKHREIVVSLFYEKCTVKYVPEKV